MPNSLKLFITFLLLFVTISQAQNKYKKVRSEKNLDWILKMDDSNADFFETVKAFRNYFNDWPLIKGTNEVEVEDDFEKQVGLELSGDDIINLQDFAFWEGKYLEFAFGVAPSDLNGDGMVDTEY